MGFWNMRLSIVLCVKSNPMVVLFNCQMPTFGTSNYNLRRERENPVNAENIEIVRASQILFA